MGLTGEQFWRMTPRDLIVHSLGYARGREERESLIAWQTAYYLAPWSKKKLTPDDLLGKNKREVYSSGEDAKLGAQAAQKRLDKNKARRLAAREQRAELREVLLDG